MALTNSTKSSTATLTNASISQRQVGSFTFAEVGTQTFNDQIGSKTFDDKYIIVTNQTKH